MKLTRLRIVGFKTFVEPTDILIQDGLTGIVGPNGCGKSNLVEALRWVMGESSYKNMRASGMDDVIFSGSTTRPARNTAEVLLAIDNAERTAPAAFNETDALEVTRRIERQQGSSYHVNGREVRARDVQLLFADAATGARSPSLVRQGQISELIQSKPQARRRVLEDAAGIAGLHARRHEAELRLRQAEENLVRVEDVLREVAAQADGLRRQGKQAARYRVLSGEIRRLEALLLADALATSRAESVEAEARAQADAAAVTGTATAQATAARDQAVAAAAVAPARAAEVEAAAALRRLTEALGALDAAERRSKERAVELKERIAELGRDLERSEGLRADAAETVARLDREAAELTEADLVLAARTDALGASAASAERELAAAESAHADLQREVAAAGARRDAATARLRTEQDGVARLTTERDRLAAEAERLGAISPGEPIDDLRGRHAVAEAAVAAAEEAGVALRARLATLREEEARSRTAHLEADRAAGRLETELRTLTKLLAADTPKGGARPIVDGVTVARGYEAALGAALGEDLDAADDPKAPFGWRPLDRTGDAALPEGVESLAAKVSGPPALARRLAQIGLVRPVDGARLQAQLRPGQRLVSAEGDLWRWDGLTVAARAPTAAARRLAERNRLAALSSEAEAARAMSDGLAAEAGRAATALRDALAEEGRGAASLSAARRAEAEARQALAAAERRHAERDQRLAGLAGARTRIETDLAEVGRRAAEAEAAVAALAAEPGRDDELHRRRAIVAEARLAAADARAAVVALGREREIGAERLAGLARERAGWTGRADRAATAEREIVARLAAARDEAAGLAAEPDDFVQRRRALAGEIRDAETRRSERADALAGAEAVLAAADRSAKAALDAMADARERRASSEARAEAARGRVEAVLRQIAERLDTDAAGLEALTGLKRGETPPDAAATETRLAAHKAERERLGAVNLRAEEELGEIEEKRDTLGAERDDLAEAIARLRAGIGSLNREGRERLAAAFAIVQGHFRRLFATLFGGGEAELQLVDSDDPLEAGLEITACPPGKRPQNLSLLSGGEQALTATALIFAIFLTNPSPICVLDEVDAPLDDANVERYCDLLRAMVDETDTRFVVITHNPITMARMDRLFGVTMAERGVSQLVSVDLERAERMLDVA